MIEICAICNGEVRFKDIKGQLFQHRGYKVLVTSSFMIRTCGSCGEKFLNHKEAKELTLLLDAQELFK